MPAGLSCCPTAVSPFGARSEQVLCHIIRHHVDVSDTWRHLKRQSVFSFALAEPVVNTVTSSPDSAKQTQVLGFRGNRIPLQPHQLCRPNLGQLWCSLRCPWRHLCFCASPKCNREVGYLKEWCQQLKVTLFCYHLETSRVWINSGHSMQFFSSSL